MRGLLSKPHLRQLEIFEYVNTHPSQSLTKLSKIMNISEKTLRQDIQEINHLLEPNKIVGTPLSGLTLELDAETSIESVYSLFLFASTEFLIIEHIFFKKFETLDSLAESLFISTSTLRRMIATINQVLSKNNFQIDSQALDLIGTETQICNFMVHYFEEKYRDSSAVFPKFQLKALNQLISYGLKKENISMNYPDMEKLRIWTSVVLYRIKAGHRFTYTAEQHARIPKHIVTNPLMKRLFKATFSIDLTEDVFFQLFFLFFNKNYCQTIEQLNSLAKHNPTINNFVSSLILFLENISTKLAIELKNKEQLVLNLYNLDTLYYGNSYILYNRYQVFIELVTHDYSNFYQFIKKEINQNLPIKNKNWSQDAINNFFYMLITHWDDLAHGIEKKIKVFSVGIFFNTDKEHMKMLKDQLSYFFENRLTFSIMTDLNISDLEKSARKYDILLTNLFNVQIKGTKIVVLPLALQASDIKKIDDIYLGLLQQSQTF
ncbi:conserved hypothetical protein [Carnobacterium maltaromaticum]|uniref:helix-turn-helix domain-containing protein n=1 Tax=Carnobacterium maltaromaticum TaxID=2751 RepID=UPI00191BC13B|nr:helix-turn-helix domain-containing protein [Carnobacterium maltaromaticum]CAD5897509.1 conserved hypothetical protein [Carnobacterium maltaromaticum]